jgi:hypothetical protein
MHAGDKGAFFSCLCAAPPLEKEPVASSRDFATGETQKKTRVTLMEKFLIFSPVKFFMFLGAWKMHRWEGRFYERGCSAQVFTSSVDN